MANTAESVISVVSMPRWAKLLARSWPWTTKESHNQLRWQKMLPTRSKCGLFKLLINIKHQVSLLKNRIWPHKLNILRCEEAGFARWEQNAHLAPMCPVGPSPNSTPYVGWVCLLSTLFQEVFLRITAVSFTTKILLLITWSDQILFYLQSL